MKKILLLIILVLVLLGAWFWMRDNTSNSDNTLPATGVINEDSPVNGMVVKGVVETVDLEQAKVDGPYVVTVKEDSGDEAIILVPSMGLPTCPAYASIASISDITEGSRIEARGSITAQGDIVPCDSPNHYLRITHTP